MTAQRDIEPAPFESNEAYLGFEMRRAHERLVLYLEAKGSRVAADRYLELAAELAESRATVSEARRLAVEAGVEIPFEGIVRRFGLGPEDEEVLMACLAPHLSSTVWQMLVAAQGNVLKPYLEVGFVAELIRPSHSLLTPRAWFEPSGTLVRSGLVVLEPPRDQSIPITLLAHAVQAPHYLASAVGGGTPLDERLMSFCELAVASREMSDLVLSEDTRAQVDEFVASFSRRGDHLELGERSWRLLVAGARHSGKTSLCQALARAFRKPILSVHLSRLGRRAETETLLHLAQRNGEFLGAVLHVVQPEIPLATEPSLLGALMRLLASYQGLVIVEPHQADKLPDALDSAIDFIIEIDRTDAVEREQLWESLLPHDAELAKDVSLHVLASSYGLNGGQIQAAIEWARQRAGTRGTRLILNQADLVAGAKSQVRTKLGDLTEASKVKLTLNDLILPKEPMDLVQEMLNAARSRLRVLNEWGFGKRLVTGKGLVSLFTGEPGTGKTLCAEILANELGLKLRIVSIPKVVSKWVGETEKNIADIFAYARAQNSMLLFDEADSLFGTRVKAEKAQDHFQNMEVNMLLQEVERFEGIVILTTNLEVNIDRAFERRILFKIEFPTPQVAERELIWRRLIPAQTPLEGNIDYKFLAEIFELTGGQIKNAIIRAAYRCYSAGTGLQEKALEQAALMQAKAAGKLTRGLEDM